MIYYRREIWTIQAQKYPAQFFRAGYSLNIKITFIQRKFHYHRHFEVPETDSAPHLPFEYSEYSAAQEHSEAPVKA